MNENSEETGKWVILNFFPHSPTDVYGFFDTEKEALDYAIKHKMDMYGNAFDIKMVLNAHYEHGRREPWE
jgi:hypothetical protein